MSVCGLYVSHVGGGGRGCRGENNTSRAVWGASRLRAGRQVGEVYAMYAKQMMGV